MDTNFVMVFTPITSSILVLVGIILLLCYLLISRKCSIKTTKRVCNTDFRHDFINKYRDRESVLEKRMKAVFESQSKREDIPLLTSWKSYQRSLPVREFFSLNCVVPLYKFPYWAEEKELAKYLIVQESSKLRGCVAYLAAPTQYGKSCSILPAFLHAAEQKMKNIENKGFTHYIYLAFGNNNGNSFKANGNQISVDLECARKQGAAFMCDCLKMIFKGTIGGVVPINKNSIDSFSEIKSLFSVFKDSEVLVHVDEHRNMADSISNVPERVEAYAFFRRGALAVLGKISQIRAVATFTDTPQLPSAYSIKSSQICREPLPIPFLKLDLVAKDLKELTLPSYKQLTSIQKRLLTTLEFRLCLKIRQMCHLHSFHESQGFLKAFQSSASNKNVDTALSKCLDLCPFECDNSYCDPVPNAAKLLVGMSEKELDDTDSKVSDVVVLGKVYTSSLEHLMSVTDSNFRVYSQGKMRLRSVLMDKNMNDFVSQTPLEAAYSWTLSCRSALCKLLEIGDNSYSIHCQRLKPGRLFEGCNDRVNKGNVLKMSLDTMYYVVEGKGQQTHPRCDIFFRTKEHELVLIDITGARDGTVKHKIRKLSDWIVREQHSLQVFKLRGIVIAPLCNSFVKSVPPACVALCGLQARHLLGGLQQLL